MEHIPLFIAFVAGLVSFLSPCVLPLVPVYLASLAGPEILETKTKRRRFPIFLHSLSFVLGLSIVFSLWGAGAGLVGAALVAYSSVIRLVAGSLLIIFGLFMLATLKVPWLNFERRLKPSLGSTTGYLRSFLTGTIFCLAWTPCVGPILGGILTIALDSATVGQGAYLLAIYALGLGLPFLAIGVAFDFITPLLKSINRYSNWVYIFSGVLLIAVGILILTNKLIWFQALA
ncbi:cytochrome c biogenesis CcdA family protein [Chloroflexota bacterium]